MKNNELYCKYHPNAPLIFDHRCGDVICSACGLVVGDRIIDVSAEWRSFDEDTGVNPSRVGQQENPFLSSGNFGTASMTEPGSNLKIMPSMSSGDRVLLWAFSEIKTMAERINLPAIIIHRANSIFKQVQDDHILCGRSNVSKVAACLYIACRQEGAPRTFKEICAVSPVSKKAIGKCFKLIVKALQTNVSRVNVDDFMSRFCATLSLPKVIERAAAHIARMAVELDIVPGRSPISVTAAAIYIASQASEYKCTQKQICEVAGTVENAMRPSYRLMLARASDLFPSEFEFHTPLAQLPDD